jgi:hypothetical protein
MRSGMEKVRTEDFGIDVVGAATRLTSYGFTCKPSLQRDAENEGVSCAASERGTGRYLKRTWVVSFDLFKGKFRAITFCA